MHRLLPCALQDYRTRHVSNWLTVPLFLLAWPVALLTGNLLLTLAVFVGVVVAWRWGGGVGPADGKVMVGMAALAPSALGLGAFLEMIAFAVLRLRGRRGAVIPGALWLYLGSVLSVAAWVVLGVIGIGHVRQDWGSRDLSAWRVYVDFLEVAESVTDSVTICAFTKRRSPS